MFSPNMLGLNLEIFSESKRKPNKVSVDQGREFSKTLCKNG